MGFLTEDNDGVLFFEGLKPDLLGEYFIFNYDSNSTIVNNIIQRSLLFPERAFSFFHRLLDDYSNEIDSNFRLFLLNINTIELSIEQICSFAKFLCERIARDNFRHSVQCLKCLNLLYMQNRGVDIAIIYAAGLFNMLDQLNLKKSRKLILELENLYYDYCDSLDVAMEYVYSLLHVMERKTLYAAKKIFEKLKILCKKVPFINNLEFNLCYAKALKVLCSKEINKYVSLEYCKELKDLFLKFSENEEFACVYAHCLCGLNTDLSNINNILIELLSLCNYTLVQPIYGMYIVENFRSGTLMKEEALNWLHNKYDFNLYIDKIEEHPITHFANMDDNLYKKDEIDCKQKNTCKPEPQESINLDIDKARKLAWLSNNLNYQQCKGVVAELKVLCERHKDTYEFIEYYLIGIVTLSKQNRQGLVESYELLENILKISNRFFNNFEEDLRISIYESISKLLDDNVFTTDLKILLDSFINMISKDLRTEQETIKIMSLFILARHSEIDAIVDDYFESVIVFYMNSNLIQKQYIKYIETKNNCDLEYILNNLPRFYSFNCEIIFTYMSNKILTFSSAYTDEKVIDFIANFLSKNKTDDLAYVYSEIIIKRFLKKPELQYYNILKSLETEYYPNFKIALNYAKLLYTVGEKGLLNFDELYNRIKVLGNTYPDKSIALIVQKILSRKVIDTISNNSYEKYIKEQKKLFDMYGTLEFAVEYCNSLSVISGNLSERENSKNYINIKKIAKNFQNKKAFEICLKRIVCEIEKSREYLCAQETTNEEVNLCNLKSQIQHLYINGGWNDVLRVEKVVKRCREAYMEFYHVDFAILLCRVLGILLKLVSNEVVGEIVNEVETIYNRYPDEPAIFKQYLKVLSSAISSNCILDGEKIDSLEKTLVQIIKKDKKCGNEIYGMLLLILHTKKNNENNKQLIEIELDSITIPPVYARTQLSRKTIDSILYHYHVWGTLDKPIEVVIIKGQYILLDGYARWIVANNNNMRLISASILAEY